MIGFLLNLQYFFDMMRNKNKNLLKLIRRGSKVQEKNMSSERALRFDQ